MTKAETIKDYMKKYNLSEAEATEMYNYDNEVDNMSMKEINATMTAEEREAVKEATRTTAEKKKKTAPKERKIDAEKREIVAEMLKMAQIFDENANIFNAEKEVCFVIGENHYSLSLIKHRIK